MKKLNNKGITTIEVLICFVLIVVITMSIYTTVSSFNERKILEGYKEKIYGYKNTLTKEIQDDFIKKGLVNAKYHKEYYYYIKVNNDSPEELVSEDRLNEINAENDNSIVPRATKTVHVVDCTLKDGTERRLEIEQLFAMSSYHSTGSKYKDDEFMIRYGTPDDMIDWDLPEIGYSGYNSIEKKVCDVDATSGDTTNCRKVQDLSINNVIISTSDDNILSIYIGFYHPEFATRYAISIVSPINYVLNESDSSTSWEY